MDKNSRQQLTLFVDKEESIEIERVRKKFNPIQQQLIDCHVTLCREDEIVNVDAVNMPVRLHEPHITLMHPRNSNCTDEIFEKIKSVTLPTILNFKTISLIEQIDGGKWKIIGKFDLRSH